MLLLKLVILSPLRCFWKKRVSLVNVKTTILDNVLWYECPVEKKKKKLVWGWNKVLKREHTTPLIISVSYSLSLGSTWSALFSPCTVLGVTGANPPLWIPLCGNEFWISPYSWVAFLDLSFYLLVIGCLCSIFVMIRFWSAHSNGLVFVILRLP